MWHAVLSAYRGGGGIDIAAALERIQDEPLRQQLRQLVVADEEVTGNATPLDCVREIKCGRLEGRIAHIRRALAQGGLGGEEQDALLHEQLALRQRVAELTRPVAAAS